MFHTLDDLVADIKRHEGIDVNLGERIRESRFMRLYSTLYPTPIDLTADREALKIRLRAYLRDARWHLPVPDQVPEQPKKKYLLYDYDQGTFTSRYLGEYSDTDELEDLMALVEEKPRRVLMIVDWSNTKITPVIRDKAGHRHASN